MAADLALIWLSWSTTYLIHSTVLLGGVWGVTRLLEGRLTDAVQETMWKAALVGGLLTASWQVLAPFEPAAGVVHLAARGGAESVAAAALGPEPQIVPGAERGRGAVAPLTAWPVPSPAQRPAVEPIAYRPPDPAFTGALLYAALGGLGVLHLLLVRRRFFAGLRDRELVLDGPMPGLLLGLVARSGFRRAVRLTCSERVATPVAFGLLQPEICVPVRALRELALPEQHSLLGHELAHLLRRDPLWLLLGQLLQRLLFVQPLQLVAVRGLHRLAEYRCDAWAARHASGGAPLARCLVQVARWIVPSRPLAVPAFGMAAQPSLLRRRVERVLAEPAREGHPRAMALGCAVALAGLAHAVPGAAWSRAGVTAPAPRLTAPRPLPAAPALSALDGELGALTQELDGLRQRVGGDTAPPPLRALLARLQQRQELLRQRRALLRSLLPASLDALRASASGGTGSVSDDTERPR